MANKKQTNPKKNTAQGSGRQEMTVCSKEELSSVLYSPMGFSFDRAFSRQIFLDEVLVAGCGHVEHIKKYVKALKVGDRLQLVREPKNKYDDLAILVKDEKGHKLGYVPRKNNAITARLMDAGKLLYAIIDDINWDPEDEEEEDDDILYVPWKLLLIAIYMED